ncbi:TonB-dependent receptor [Woodsholea maritima]|uniref:TonB-dependent receptor n=1 Tax=Woodsholea maritima TaxID=240237 RepID=UPI00146150E5|nr:TonB-dependent receptor [Woodsholea maritima]
MMSNRGRTRFATGVTLGALVIATLAGGAAIADPNHDTRDVITVYARQGGLVGAAKSSSAGSVLYDTFSARPLSRVGELVEVIPGVVATQHSGEGKANQYFLRGFNLDHGTDFSAELDGMPLNFRSHGHGQGYLDLNILLPEVIARVDYRKGLSSAQTGDFSAAGSAFFVTADKLDHTVYELTLGENGYGRFVGAGSVPVAGGELLLAGAYSQYDGPWVLDQDLNSVKGLVKYSRDVGAWNFAGTLMAYDASWDATDQIPQYAIDAGLIDRLGYVDPDLGGSTRYYAGNVQARYAHANGATTQMNAYARRYEFSLFSNFTYFLEDPVRGDEFEQGDQRWTYGARIRHGASQYWGDMRVLLSVGAEWQWDHIDRVGLYKTQARRRHDTVRQDNLDEVSLAGFAEAELFLSPSWRAVVGARVDHYRADVSAQTLEANSGKSDDTLVSPNIALAWKASNSLEFYGNYGEGFHSNDARGATISIDPVSGEGVDAVDLLAKGRGAELGARWEQGPVHATLTGFWLDLDSELIYVGDGGATEANDASRRYGVEATAYWTLNDYLTLDLAASWTDAKLKGVDGAEDRIAGAVESVVAAGLIGQWQNWTGTLRVRHFGEAPLIEDESEMSEPTTVVNASAHYALNHWQVGIDVLNLFDSQDADITYLYESRLSPSADVVEGRHIHPVEPRSVRVRLSTRF